ncbi:hypothetical protein HHI36_023335 [Cryptolaemus montrouzieri]|uniref:Uncharacterized protein n=1 Tax=Cryptolaemus montrouzieri TaxID=559131 RepID=A0ABD2PGN3_9CUCU
MPSNGCVWHAIRAGGMPSNLPEKISPKLVSLIYRMMAYEIQDRPNANEISNCSIIASVAARDVLAERTDYVRLIAVSTRSFPNIMNADVRRVLNDIADSADGNLFQTPVNRAVTRKIAFSPGGDGIPRRMNTKSSTSTKDFRRSPRMKLFL